MVALPRHPWDDRTVVETHRKFGAHRKPARPTTQDADEMAGPVAPQGHEVDQGGGSALSLNIRLEDKGAFAITARDPGARARGGNFPVAVVLVAEQRRENRPGVEARPAKPID